MVSGHWTQSKGLRPDLRLLSAGFFYVRACIMLLCLSHLFLSMDPQRRGDYPHMVPAESKIPRAYAAC